MHEINWNGNKSSVLTGNNSCIQQCTQYTEIQRFELQLSNEIIYFKLWDQSPVLTSKFCGQIFCQNKGKINSVIFCLFNSFVNTFKVNL